MTISSDFDNIDRLIIIDHTGKKIVTNNDVGKELQFNVAKFPAGIYSILCYVDDKILLSKFVVEH